MRRAGLLLIAIALLLGSAAETQPAPAADEALKKKRAQLLEIYGKEAAGYTIFRDSSRREKVTLQPEPVYVWTNAVRGKGQDGAVYVWTCRGRAEVIGTFFSYPAIGPRSLNHELHSLSVSVLDVARQGPNSWTPLAPGLEPKPIAAAPSPATTAAQRLLQMRALTREFAASTRDDQENRWDLRLLPQPLYRYESTDPNVLDGAVFAFVTSAGTDPEILLVLEARKPGDGREPVWCFGLARFTDLHYWVRHQGKEIASGVLIPYDAPEQDLKQRYRAFRDRGIPAVEAEAP